MAAVPRSASVARARRAQTASCGRTRARISRRSDCCRETAAGAGHRRASIARDAKSGSFQSQVLQRAHVISPVLAHLDPQRQMKTAAKEMVELQARGTPDA